MYEDANEERQQLINHKTNSCNNDDQCQPQSSRLEWAESSWTRCLHVLCWWWISPTLSIGYKRPLTESDLDGLPQNDKSSVLLNRLESYHWTIASTGKILIQEFWKEYIWVGIVCIPYLFSRVVQPLLLRQIVLSTMDKDVSLFTIYTFIILLCLFGIVQVISDHQVFFLSSRVGVRIRNALTSILYKHSLSIKSTVWQHMNTGEIINLITNSASKLEEMCSILYLVLEGPLQVIIIFALLCWIVGPIPTLVGCVTFCVSMVTVFLSSRYLGKYNAMKVSCSNKRIHAFNEFIHGCYIVKMYNWEKSMEDRITQMRRDELVALKRVYTLKNINTIYSFILSPLLALTTFGTAWILDYPLRAVDCFTAISFFSLLRNQVLFLLPLLTERLTDVKVALKRIDSFMRLTIMQDQNTSTLPKASVRYSEKGRIVMSNASFSWHDDSCCLSSLNIIIEPGTLVGIVGGVGSGKSSLLASILGEMTLINGEFTTNNSSFSYAAQSSWIFSDTIRNNILLNRPFDEEKYRDVICACCLDVDLSLFGTSGDLTVIGERGVNLSGGQKARVSLARALYDEADIYLIDDPLAAVDGNVAKQIYERCFSSKGLLKNKTRLLVTHQTQFLNEAQQIIFLSHGQIDQEGRLDQYINSENHKDKNETSKLATMLDENIPMPDTQPIIAKEIPVSGKINWTVWFRLFTAPPFGISGFCLLIILLVLAQVFYDGTNYWLSICLRR
jgi:ATP-binding cassette subfamily C (CFTR/MRP) protein 4